MKFLVSPRRLGRFLASPTGRLAESYLLIIMLMSIGFSLVFYVASSAQLGRQYPPDELLHQGRQSQGQSTGQTPPTDSDDQHKIPKGDIEAFLRSRIEEGREVLRSRLVYVNLGALVLGGLVSYLLARRALRPIEDAMEAQAQFVSDASHELRTPLTAIQTSNEVALRKPKLTVAELKSLVERNNEDIARLKQLSDGLLSLAQRSTAKQVLELVSVQEVVSEAMTHVIPQATAKHITVHDEVDDLKVLGSKNALAQVLVILLDNAVKYSGEATNIHLRSRTKGKSAYIDVSDEGVGIRASDIPHLFGRFYRADSARSASEHGGYGLGLAIAKSIMVNHDGDIAVASKVGQGSTFTLRLPLATMR